MKTALALVAVLGLMGVGVAVSNPPKGKEKIKAQPVAKLSPLGATSGAQPALPPSLVPGSPRGWLVQSPGYSVTIPHISVLAATSLNADGSVRTVGPVELDHGIPGGMTMHGAVYGNWPGTHPIAGIKVRVNGPSEVHLPGRSGFGTGPSTPAGSFTLSGGITVTAIP